MLVTKDVVKDQAALLTALAWGDCLGIDNLVELG